MEARPRRRQLRGRTFALLLLLAAPPAAALAGCAAAGSTPASGTAHPTEAPRPDLCRLIDRQEVGATFHGKVTACEQAPGRGDYFATFSGEAEIAGRRSAATVTVGYLPRYDPHSGVDRWITMGAPGKSGVPMIGVGDNSIFDGSATDRPQLVAATKEVIISVVIRIKDAKVPQDRLPDHVMRIGEQAVSALR